MNTKKCWTLELSLVLVAVVCIALLVLGFGGFRFNATPSLPRGLYQLTDGRPQRGDLVSFCLNAENQYSTLARDRGYLRPGACPSGLQPLLKRLVGMPGDYLEISKAGLTMNGIQLPGTALPIADSLWRPLPPTLLANGRIPEGSGLVLSQDHEGSFDSRHFGLVSYDSLEKIRPVLVFKWR